MTTRKSHSLSLSEDEAVVFYEWLSKMEAAGDDKEPAGCEEFVLWSVQSQLEKSLEALFSRDYESLLRQACGRIVEGQ